MKSLQWRMMLPLGAILLVAWGMTISMMAVNLTHGQGGFWERQLDGVGGLILRLLPAGVLADVGAGQEMRDFRNGLVALALNTVQLVVVAFLMWAVVRISLWPLRSLSLEITRRKPFDATPLPVERVPEEVRPLIVSFNALLIRVDKAVQGERQFIADAAHELRTPLSALHAYAEVARGARTLEEKDRALGRLIEVSRRSNRLAEQLLDHARLDAGLNPAGYGRVEIDALARHVIGEFSVEAEARGVQLRLQGSHCRVECDLDAIGTLIRNLVDNAIRHGRENGVVEVRCGYDCRGRDIHPFVEVDDDGPGVPAEERDAIFKRFYRLAGSEARGSGIGLALVAGIARLHDAKVETGTGMDGRGFRVRVLFPADPELAGA
ncbi:MAG: ATP-binding protein [Pseudomonas sp.]